MSDYRYGDYVVYDPGYKDPEIGRVTGISGTGWFVCFDMGCTSKSTPAGLLRPATPDEIAAAPAGIGYHRFDDECPDWDPRICYASCLR